MKIQQFITNKGCVAFISFFLLISCGSENTEMPSNILQDIIPKNLIISVNIIGSDATNVNGDGSGSIEVTVSATDAVAYVIKFGDGNEASNTTGIFEHSYAAQGLNSFTVQVFATSTTDDTIGEFKKINVLNSQDGMTLIWSDEFNTDGAPDTANWGYDLGANNGWGNGEAQYYTNSVNNVIVADGLLKITARKESFQGFEYTSSRLLSKGKFDFTYGKVEVRAKLPTGKGTWPAIWMLGANFESVGWPSCGEIDIMEHVGNDEDNIHATLHYPNNFGGNGNGSSIMLSNVSSEFHIYEVIWDANSIQFSADGTIYHTFSNSTDVPFNGDFFLILNVAMGGSFGGAIDSGFTSSTMEIDYVKVYQ